MARATDLRKGKVINYQGAPHQVMEMQHRTQGRGQGWVQATMRNLSTGSSTVVKFGSTENIEFLMTETRKLEFSYEDQGSFVFMDPETFESSEISTDIINENVRKYLVPNNEYEFMLVDDKPIDIVLPNTISMKVVESPEGLRGDTASNVQKPATMETGLVVQVPLFIKEGEVIKVNTADGSYSGRA
ncbi:MAG: elongation factor P [Opitutales bacterium]